MPRLDSNCTLVFIERLLRNALKNVFTGFPLEKYEIGKATLI